jgi:hypothetical protein
VAVKGKQVAVGNSTPARLTTVATDYNSGQSGLIRNRGSVAVFVGGSDVTASGANAGFQLDAGEAIPMDLFDGEVPYGICASSQTSTVHVLESGV